MIVVTRLTLLAAVVTCLMTPGPAQSSDEKQIGYAVIFKPVCDQVIPGYAAENAANYATWRRQNQAAIEAMEREPDVAMKQRQLNGLPNRKVRQARIQLEDPRLLEGIR